MMHYGLEASIDEAWWAGSSDLFAPPDMKSEAVASFVTKDWSYPYPNAYTDPDAPSEPEIDLYIVPVSV